MKAMCAEMMKCEKDDKAACEMVSDKLWEKKSTAMFMDLGKKCLTDVLKMSDEMKKTCGMLEKCGENDKMMCEKLLIMMIMKEHMDDDKKGGGDKPDDDQGKLESLLKATMASCKKRNFLAKKPELC